jgi:CRISPR/Cas system endoribonuclease Cas6 (RAMP superfamily)
MHSITRITTTIEATQTVAWPHFAGSTLRGAFGRALRQAACITGQDKCGGCPLRNSCAYGVVFDPAASAQPLHPSFRDGLPRYMVQPPALGACPLSVGETQSFDLLLLPGTQAHHGLIEHILRTAVEKELFQPGLFKLLGTQVSQDSVPQSLTLPQMPGSDNTTPANTHPATTHITLRWLTPLRLQQQGKPVFKPQQLNAQGLVHALLRRQMQWQQITDQKPQASPATSTPEQQDPLRCAPACTLDTRLLQWHDIQRHSGTQNQKLPLGGLIGAATLSGPTAAMHTLLPLLQLGERLQIGKETVMGLGRYQLNA